MKLSIIIPCYNEERTITEILRKVIDVKLEEALDKEIIIVDDGSEDNTREKTIELINGEKDIEIQLIAKENEGKGSAIRLGLEKITGDLVIIQDADLEYSPEDYNILIRPMIHNGADVVYGNRLHKGNARHSYLSFFLGGKLLTLITNILFSAGIHDEPTCYKLFRTEILNKVKLRCRGFEFCPEVTAKVRRLGYKITEVPIRYTPRSIEEGKKIDWRDGLIAIYTLIKYRLIPKSLW